MILAAMTMTDPHPLSAPDDSLWAQIARRPSLAFILGSAALFVITLLAYTRAFNADFVWDDDYYVTNNATLRSGDGLQQIWFEPGATTQYYPMVHTSFWIEYHLWGLSPRGYHITNVLLHALGASLLWTVLKRLNVPGAWAAAAIFALHPVHVESVAWIAERKNVLSGVFYFGAMLVYLRACGITPATITTEPIPTATSTAEPIVGASSSVVDAGAKKENLFSLPTDPTRLFGLVAVLFAAALLSKSVTATFPAAVLVIIWWKRGRLTWNDVVPLIPLFAMGIAMGVYTSVLERDMIGASGKDWDFAPTAAGEVAARFIIAGRAIWFYLGKLVAPFPLIFNYPRFDISPNRPLLYLFPIAASGVIGALFGLRSRIGRAPLAAWLLFVGSLFPVLGFLNVYPMRYSFVADHFDYLPSIALIVLFVAGAKRACDWLVSREMLAPWAAPAAAAMLIVLLGVGTIMQTEMYRDEQTLLITTINRNSHSWWAANNYGDWILANDHFPPRERFEKAEIWARRTMKLKPDHPEARIKLGLIAMQRGDDAQALYWFDDAVKQQPNHPLAQFNLGRMLMSFGRNEEALAQYEKLVREQPKYEDARTNLGLLLARAGRMEEAVAQFQEVLKLNPQSPDAHFKMGQAYLRAGGMQDAFAEFKQVITLQPKNTQVRLTLGDTVLQQTERMSDEDRWAEAEAQYRLALSFDPNLAPAYHQLGVIRMEQGKPREAIAFFEQTLKFAPKNETAKRSLEDAQRELAHPSTRPTSRRSSTTRRSALDGTSRPRAMISAPAPSNTAPVNGSGVDGAPTSRGTP